MKKPFQYQEAENIYKNNDKFTVSMNVKKDLMQYIKKNLNDFSIVVNDGRENISFPFNFKPQTSGTITQQNAYLEQEVEKIADKIITVIRTKKNDYFIN